MHCVTVFNATCRVNNLRMEPEKWKSFVLLRSLREGDLKGLEDLLIRMGDKVDRSERKERGYLEVLVYFIIIFYFVYRFWFLSPHLAHLPFSPLLSLSPYYVDTPPPFPPREGRSDAHFRPRYSLRAPNYDTSAACLPQHSKRLVKH